LIKLLLGLNQKPTSRTKKVREAMVVPVEDIVIGSFLHLAFRTIAPVMRTTTIGLRPKRTAVANSMPVI